MHLSAMEPAKTKADSGFGRSILSALILEGLLLGGWLFYRSLVPPVAGLQRAPVTIHMVILAPARPKPLSRPQPLVRPQPKPIPKPKPVVKPPPRIVHHTVPLPRPLSKKPLVKQRPKPRPPVKAASPRQTATAVDRYAVMIRTRIQDGLRVPGMVRALGLSGSAVIAFALTPDGHVLWARVKRSSGFGPIDRACLAAVRSRVYPPFTPNMPHRPVRFDVTVSMRDH